MSATLGPPTSDRRARRHEDTRREILEAAWQLARQRGLTGWSLRELAAAVGMRAPSLYGYFTGKQQIYDAMYAQGYTEILAASRALPRKDPTTTLRLTARAFVEFAVADPARLQLMFLRVIPDFEPSEESYAIALEVLETLRELLADAGMDDQRSMDLWTGTLTGLATQQVSNEPGGDRWIRLVEPVVDMLLDHARKHQGATTETLPPPA